MILEPRIYSDPCIKKLDKPILTKADIPYAATLIFNAGVAKFNGKYGMLFRNDYGTCEERFSGPNPDYSHDTSIGVAFSDNGVDNWQVVPKPLIDSAMLDKENGEVLRYYDPRLTIIDGEPYVCLAIDTKHGVCGCVGKINEHFDKLEIISTTVPDNRNLVLFPEKIGGKYVRLERPFPVYSRGCDRFDMWLSKSPDLKYWGESSLVLGVEHVPYANDKIGPAAPPIKTEKGWLTTFHAVDIDQSRGKNGWEKRWPKRYSGGIMLLDLENPEKVIGMSKKPLIAPELYYETDEGFRQNAIFPGGMILEPDGEVKIYYGASDMVECLATANIDDLIKICCEER